MIQLFGRIFPRKDVLTYIACASPGFAVQNTCVTWQAFKIVQLAKALEVKEYTETSALQELLLRNPERYRNVICDRNQDAAQLALTLPANLQYQTQDPLREQQQIFRMFIEYSVYSGMSIKAKIDTIQRALNKFLDAL